LRSRFRWPRLHVLRELLKMSIRILFDPKERKACLYDSVSDTAFGPLFYESEDPKDYRDAELVALDFLNWHKENFPTEDLRDLSDYDVEQRVISYLPPIDEGEKPEYRMSDEIADLYGENLDNEDRNSDTN